MLLRLVLMQFDLSLVESTTNSEHYGANSHLLRSILIIVSGEKKHRHY